VKLLLAIAVVAAFAALSRGADTAVARVPTTCVVPRVFGFMPSAAEVRLAAAGCSLGGIAFERPHPRVARVTGQVPAPGAVLPRRTRVSLLFS